MCFCPISGAHTRVYAHYVRMVSYLLLCTMICRYVLLYAHMCIYACCITPSEIRLCNKNKNKIGKNDLCMRYWSVYYTCVPVLDFLFLDLVGQVGRCDDARPRVGGVKPKDEHCSTNIFQCCQLTRRRTLLAAESFSKLNGPTRATLWGPARGRGSVHSMYLVGFGVWCGGKSTLSPYTMRLVVVSR